MFASRSSSAVGGVILQLVLVVCSASASITIVHPQNGESVVAKDSSLWLEFRADGFDLSPGKGTAAVFVNGDFFLQTQETGVGLEITETGPMMIEVQLRLEDDENTVVDRAQVQVHVTLPPPSPSSAPTHEPLRYVPQEGDTMPFGSIFLLSPRPGSVVSAGTIPIRFRLRDVPNGHIALVHIFFNTQEVHVFQGQEYGEIHLPDVPAGKWSITAVLGGHPNHVALEMQATSEFTVVNGEAPAVDADLLGEPVEAEPSESADGNLILTAGSETDQPALYADFLSSLRDSKSQSDVIIFVPSPPNQEVLQLAAKYRATVVPYHTQHIPSACRGDIGNGVECVRFFLFRAIMFDRLAEYAGASVILTELDTIFQTNPFSLEELRSQLVVHAISDALVIEDDDETSLYTTDQCDHFASQPELFATVGPKHVLWSGVWGGVWERVLEELDGVCTVLTESTAKRSKKFADIPAREYINPCHIQGVFNVRAHRSQEGQEPLVLSSESGPVFVAHKWPSLRLSADNKILLPGESSAPAGVVVGAHAFEEVKTGNGAREAKRTNKK